ncbi:MAG: ferredoxin reductase, partial [Chloroflexi bacterium]|nr:ferredoxin reductase [Chloroflexota bacterium]
MKGPLEWQIATVKKIKPETPKVKSFTLALPAWSPHKAGQHYDIRLTAPDGYQAQRSYSIASEPERAGEVDLTIEKIEDGEVSPYMHDVLRVGDQIEVRGPIGGYFVWEAKMNGPLMLIAGGSGVVPLMAMVRHRAAAQSHVPTRLLFSSRTPDDAIYFAELEQLRGSMDGLEVFHTFTRVQPPGWKGYARRIDKEMLSEGAKPLGKTPQIFICGPTPLVEAAANTLVQIGIPAGAIKT